ATTALYTLSLHDALPISAPVRAVSAGAGILDGPHRNRGTRLPKRRDITLRDTTLVESGCDDGGHFCLALLKSPEMSRNAQPGTRSEEHTSELQSRGHLVC